MSKENCIFEERKHLEDLLQQRFNFYIVMFGFAVAAGAQIQNGFMRGICLFPLTLITTLIWIPLWRAGKLARAAKELIERDEKDSAFMKVREKAGIDREPSAAFVMIYCVPVFSLLFLFIWALLSLGCNCGS